MSPSPPLRVADVFRAHWEAYLGRHRVPAYVHKAVRHLLACRTPALGGHVWQCAACGRQAILYNSCRDRNCPTCQGVARERWLRQRMDELIPVPYFHVVFTLPHDLNPLIRYNRKPLLDLLFREVGATFQEFARDPQWRLEGQLGFLAVLHTWSQTLREHHHLHCAVPGGVWRRETGTWISARRNWLFRASSLADRFGHRYLRALRRLLNADKLILPETETDWSARIDQLAHTPWIVYAKKPFAGPAQVLEYLGRYTHKVAISDYRILAIDGDRVTFRYRDRADQDREKHLTLSADAFITRFLHHILPEHFHKIRFYGWMARTVRRDNLRAIREALVYTPPLPPPFVPTPPTCPCCGQPSLRLTPRILFPRGPPKP